MRAVVVPEACVPEVLGLEEVPDPQPGDGELLVRVEAGRRQPRRPDESCGKLPDGREDRGDRVLVTDTDGSHAELVAAKEQDVFALPDSLDTAALTPGDERDAARKTGELLEAVHRFVKTP